MSDGASAAAAAAADSAPASFGAGVESLPLDAAVPADAGAALLELGWYPSHLVMQGVEMIHVSSGLPYWATIIAITFGLRSLMLPLAFGTMRNAARMAVMKPELELVMNRMKSDPGANNDPKRQAMYRTQMNALFSKHNCSPMKSLYFPFAQLPVFMSFFFGLKTMGEYYPEISTGGALWFTDLSAADPTMIFPLVTAASFLTMIEIGADGMAQSDQQATMKMAMRGMALLMVPFTYQMPCAVFCYWSTANAFSLTQTLALKVPGVREALDVPLPPKPPPTQATALPDKVDPLQSPIKTLLAKVNGESLDKHPIASATVPPPPPPGGAPSLKDSAGDGSVAAGSFMFDDKKHVKVAVHSQKRQKRGKSSGFKK